MDNSPQVDGDDGFSLGMNGYTIPAKLPPGQFVLGMNLICRGGIAQTRPGSQSLFDMPDGNLQGMTYFKPSSGPSQLVFAVDGVVYQSSYPFRTYSQIPNIQFSATSKFISWASCIKSTDYTDAGVLYYIDNPHSVLVMQDGDTRAAYWDGSASGHLNPTPSNSEIAIPGTDETPIGLWMIWSNNRLWVSRGSQVFASDIGNPLKFTERTYLNEARSFYLPAACTGIAEVSNTSAGGSASGYPGIMCFTSGTGTFIMSSLQDRTQWLQTPGFQQLAFANTGCIAPRSIVHQYGVLWWYTSKGLISQNAALSANISSRLDIQDNEMIQSKFNLSYDLSGVCGSFTENFLFHGVPNADKLNTRLHVLDQAPFSNASTPLGTSLNAWASYWMGWRPVEFARGIINSAERVFCASIDYDGVNRAWELFRPDKTDNGIPITSFLITKQHFFGNRDYKKFKYAEVEFQGIVGPTAVLVGAAGIKGGFQSIATKDINSIFGQIYYSAQYGPDLNKFYGTSPQTRIVKTMDGANPSDCNSACVESEERGLIDKSFQVIIAWSGIAGVSAYRMFVVSEPRPYSGICEDDEDDELRILSPDGCGANDWFTTDTPFPSYSAQATFAKIDPSTGTLVSHTSLQSSLINQQDANRKATTTAQWYVLSQIGEII